MGDMSSDRTPEQGAAAEKRPFPRTFYYANGIELLERLAHYGVYVGLALYLSNVVKMSDPEVGIVLGNFRFVGSMAPIPCGAIADRITFKRSLMIAFIGYAVGLLVPARLPGEAAGHPLARAHRGVGRLLEAGHHRHRRAHEPARARGRGLRHLLSDGELGERRRKDARVPRPPLRRAAPRRGHVDRGEPRCAGPRDLRVHRARRTRPRRRRARASASCCAGTGRRSGTFASRAFLVVFAGFYFMAEQFYFTFPQYVTRHIDKKAPLEIITLINPALIAIFQGVVTRAVKRLPPVTAMTLGVLIGSRARCS